MAYMKLLIAVALIAGVDQAVAQFFGNGGGVGAMAMAGAGAGAGLFGPGFPFNNMQNPWNLVGIPGPAVNLLSPADIASVQPGLNSHGMTMTSSSSSRVGPNGEVIRTGGGTIMTNDNGRISAVHYGDSTPNVDSNTQTYQSARMPEIPEIKMSEFPKIKMPKFPKLKKPKFPKIKKPKFPEMKMPEFPEMKMPDFPEMDFPEFPDIEMPEFPDIEIPETPKMPDSVKIKNYVPSEGENFVSISSISNSHSTDVNGEKKLVGRAEIYINNNGKVHSEVIHFGDKPKGDEKDKGGKENHEEDGKDGDEVKVGDEASKGAEENDVKEITLGDLDKYKIV